MGLFIFQLRHNCYIFSKNGSRLPSGTNNYLEFAILASVFQTPTGKTNTSALALDDSILNWQNSPTQMLTTSTPQLRDAAAHPPFWAGFQDFYAFAGFVALPIINKPIGKRQSIPGTNWSTRTQWKKELEWQVGYELGWNPVFVVEHD